MQNEDYPLTIEEFRDIYSKVPRLTVEVVVRSSEGFLLTLRNIEPYKGTWHIPGGTVYLGESLENAVKRISKKELGVKVKSVKFLSYIEYPSHMEESFDAPVGLAFLVDFDGEIKLNDEASDMGWFKEMPKNTHPEQGAFLEKLL